jgi:hypothetical protein
MIREQEDEQEQLDDHTDLITQDEYLSDDDHHRSRSCLRRNTCTSTQAMDNKRGPDAVRRGERLHQNERFKSAPSSAKKDVVSDSPMIATTTESKQGAAPGDKDKIKNHGPAAEPKTADAEGEENHSRILNATDLTSQIYDDDEKDSEDGEHDAYHSNHKAEEDANVSTKKQSRKDAPSTTFPQHLMDVIELESQHSKPSILEWVDVNGGDAFLIRDKEAFEQNIVPKYFSRGVTKCKFMSFARKLYRYVPFQPTLPLLCKDTVYTVLRLLFVSSSHSCYHTRWGFRQVLEKSSPSSNNGTSMIFMHPNFVRGDRKRCLLMRSIVKRPMSTSTSLRKSSQHGVEGRVVVKDVPVDAERYPYSPAISINSLHAFGSSALCLGQQEQSVTPIMAHQVNILPVSSYLPNMAYQEMYNCPSSTTQQEISSRVASTSEVFETSSRMQHHSEILDQLLQQRRQELVRQILSVGMKDGSRAVDRVLPAAMALLPHYSQPLPIWPQPAAMGPPPSCTSFGHYSNFLLGRLMTTGSVNVTPLDTPVVVLLASHIMKNNPSMEPWRALELAKKSLP